MSDGAKAYRRELKIKIKVEENALWKKINWNLLCAVFIMKRKLMWASLSSSFIPANVVCAENFWHFSSTLINSI